MSLHFWSASANFVLLAITAASACPNSAAIRCFQGSQTAVCAGASLANSSHACPSSPVINPNEYDTVYCVLIKYKCTRVSECTKTRPAPNMKWSDAVFACAIIPPILSDSGCSSQEVARNTTKWVSRPLIASTVHVLGFNTTSSCVDKPVWNDFESASMCFCASDYCNNPMGLSQKTEPATDVHDDCAYALLDFPDQGTVGTITSGNPATTAPPSIVINNYITVIVIIFQFKAPYQLSEITPELESRMSQAVAAVLGVNATSVSLTFVEVDMRRRRLLQQKGVLVSVSLKNLQGSASPFVSRLSQDSINHQMAAAGLRTVQLVQNGTVISTGNATSANVQMGGSGAKSAGIHTATIPLSRSRACWLVFIVLAVFKLL